MRVKICCISSVAEARLAVGHGASALGLVSAMPSGPGVISEALIAEIADSVPPPVATFLLTSKTDAATIIDQQRRCRTNTLQLCDTVTADVHRELRVALPGVSLLQVIHVRGDQTVAEAVDAARTVDALLLDSGNASAKVKESGGTGRTHDWSVSSRIVRESSAPVFLAGGLHAHNVAEAIRSVGPFAVDLCSGVRETGAVGTTGALSEDKLAAFMATVRATL